MTYVIDANDPSKVTIGSYSGNAASVVIPVHPTNPAAPNEEYIVVGVGAGAFKNKTALESITLPNSIEVIGSEAFKGCTNLSSMTTTD